MSTVHAELEQSAEIPPGAQEEPEAPLREPSSEEAWVKTTNEMASVICAPDNELEATHYYGAIARMTERMKLSASAMEEKTKEFNGKKKVGDRGGGPWKAIGTSPMKKTRYLSRVTVPMCIIAVLSRAAPRQRNTSEIVSEFLKSAIKLLIASIKPPHLQLCQPISDALIALIVPGGFSTDANEDPSEPQNAPYYLSLPPEKGDSKTKKRFRFANEMPNLRSPPPVSLLTTLEYFGEAGGFSAILEALEARRDGYPAADPEAISGLLEIPKGCIGVLAPGFIAEMSGVFVKAALGYLLSLDDDTTRSLSKRVWHLIVLAVKPFIHYEQEGEGINKTIELFQLDFALKQLKSPYLDRRIVGINDIKAFVRSAQEKKAYQSDINKSATAGAFSGIFAPLAVATSPPPPPPSLRMWITTAELVRYLEAREVLESLLSPASTHLEIVRRCESLLELLAEEGAIKRSHIDALWQLAASEQHESIEHTVYNIFARLLKSLSLEDAAYLFQKIKEKPFSKYDTQMIRFVRDTSMALYTKEMEGKSRNQILTEWYGLTLLWDTIHPVAAKMRAKALSDKKSKGLGTPRDSQGTNGHKKPKKTNEGKSSRGKASLPQGLMDVSMEAVLDILSKEPGKSQRQALMDLCVESVKEGEEVAISLHLLRKILETFPQTHRAWYTASNVNSMWGVIENLESRHGLLEICLNDIAITKGRAASLLEHQKEKKRRHRREALGTKSPRDSLLTTAANTNLNSTNNTDPTGIKKSYSFSSAVSENSLTRSLSIASLDDLGGNSRDQQGAGNGIVAIHAMEVAVRVEFLKFILTNSGLVLDTLQALNFWEVMVGSALTDSDRDACYDWLHNVCHTARPSPSPKMDSKLSGLVARWGGSGSTKKAFRVMSDTTKSEVFLKRVLMMPPAQVSPAGYRMAEAFFLHHNIKVGSLRLVNYAEPPHPGTWEPLRGPLGRAEGDRALDGVAEERRRLVVDAYPKIEGLRFLLAVVATAESPEVAQRAGALIIACHTSFADPQAATRGSPVSPPPSPVNAISTRQSKFLRLLVRQMAATSRVGRRRPSHRFADLLAAYISHLAHVGKELPKVGGSIWGGGGAPSGEMEILIIPVPSLRVGRFMVQLPKHAKVGDLLNEVSLQFRAEARGISKESLTLLLHGCPLAMDPGPTLGSLEFHKTPSNGSPPAMARPSSVKSIVVCRRPALNPPVLDRAFSVGDLQHSRALQSLEGLRKPGPLAWSAITKGKSKLKGRTRPHAPRGRMISVGEMEVYQRLFAMASSTPDDNTRSVKNSSMMARNNPSDGKTRKKDSKSLQTDQLLNQKVWRLLRLLPSSEYHLLRLALLPVGGGGKAINWAEVFDPTRPHELLYALRVTETLRSLPESPDNPQPDFRKFAPRGWSNAFIASGGLKHLLSIAAAGAVGAAPGVRAYALAYETLAALLRVAHELLTLDPTYREEVDAGDVKSGGYPAVRVSGLTKVVTGLVDLVLAIIARISASSTLRSRAEIAAASRLMSAAGAFLAGCLRVVPSCALRLIPHPHLPLVLQASFFLTPKSGKGKVKEETAAKEAPNVGTTTPAESSRIENGEQSVLHDIDEGAWGPDWAPIPPAYDAEALARTFFRMCVRSTVLLSEKKNPPTCTANRSSAKFHLENKPGQTSVPIGKTQSVESAKLELESEASGGGKGEGSEPHPRSLRAAVLHHLLTLTSCQAENSTDSLRTSAGLSLTVQLSVDHRRNPAYYPKALLNIAKKILPPLLLWRLLEIRPLAEASSVSGSRGRAKNVKALVQGLRLLVENGMAGGPDDRARILQAVFDSCVHSQPDVKSDAGYEQYAGFSTKATRRTIAPLPNHVAREVYLLLDVLASGSGAALSRLTRSLSPLPMLAATGSVATRGAAGDGGERRAARGFVGLKNQGATCYMNAVLQQMFSIKTFRESVLRAGFGDTQASDMTPSSSTETTAETEREREKHERDKREDEALRELRLVFAHLHGSERKAYDAMGFCQTFSWADGRPINVSEQQDAQEFFSRVLDLVHERSKSLKLQESPELIFQGILEHQTISLESEHQSNKEERFYHLSLAVQNKANLLESLSLYVKGDVLDADNKVMIAGKKRTALKRACIKMAPNVMVFHLKRFYTNFDTMRMVKINQRFEFPTELDLFPYSIHGVTPIEREGKKVCQGEDSKNPGDVRREEWLYRLKGIVVHTGQASSGHYFSYIRVGRGETWAEFNDKMIRRFDPRLIARETFGGTRKVMKNDIKTREKVPTFTDIIQNAYMLFYEKIYPSGHPALGTKGPDPALEYHPPPKHPPLLRRASGVERGSVLSLNRLPTTVREVVALDNASFALGERLSDIAFQEFLWRFALDTCPGLPGGERGRFFEMLARFVFWFLPQNMETRATVPQYLTALHREIVVSSESRRAFLQSLVDPNQKPSWHHRVLIESRDVAIRESLADLLGAAFAGEGKEAKNLLVAIGKNLMEHLDLTRRKGAFQAEYLKTLTYLITATDGPCSTHSARGSIESPGFPNLGVSIKGVEIRQRIMEIGTIRVLISYYRDFVHASTPRDDSDIIVYPPMNEIFSAISALVLGSKTGSIHTVKSGVELAEMPKKCFEALFEGEGPTAGLGLLLGAASADDASAERIREILCWWAFKDRRLSGAFIQAALDAVGSSAELGLRPVFHVLSGFISIVDPLQRARVEVVLNRIAAHIEHLYRMRSMGEEIRLAIASEFVLHNAPKFPVFCDRLLKLFDQLSFFRCLDSEMKRMNSQ